MKLVGAAATATALSETPAPAERRTIALSVVVPTFNERQNVALIVASLAKALGNIEWEVLFVDDASPDGTADEVRRIARDDHRVRLVLRHNRRGLSSAVIEGALAASGEIVAVMDGDLQHDEGLLPELYSRVASGACDIASASRFLNEARPEGLSSDTRVQISNSGIALANFLFDTKLTDPLTGFFVLRRDVMQRALPHLSELGFKILLDLVVSLKPRPVVEECAFTFRARVHGESKLDNRVMYDFFLFFMEKMVGRYLPLPARFLSFALVNGVGILVHLAVLIPMVSLFGVDFPLAQLYATSVSLLFNYTANNFLTYRDATLKGLRFWIGFFSFSALSSIGIISNVGIAAMIYKDFGIFYAIPAVAGALITVVWNYAATRMWVWGGNRKKNLKKVAANAG